MADHKLSLTASKPLGLGWSIYAFGYSLTSGFRFRMDYLRFSWRQLAQKT